MGMKWLEDALLLANRRIAELEADNVRLKAELIVALQTEMCSTCGEELERCNQQLRKSIDPRTENTKSS